jgi:hypothetical protein
MPILTARPLPIQLLQRICLDDIQNCDQCEQDPGLMDRRGTIAWNDVPAAAADERAKASFWALCEMREASYY